MSFASLASKVFLPDVTLTPTAKAFRTQIGIGMPDYQRRVYVAYSAVLET